MIDSMYERGVDTGKVTKALEKAGFESLQAKALVAAFGGSVAAGAGTREDLRDLRNATREDNRLLRGDLRGEIAELRSETRTEFVAVRGEIAELRSETRAEFAAVREEIATVREEVATVRAEVADLRNEIVNVRSACQGDIKNLRAHMYGLLLAQATVIVSLILGLQRLL